MLKFDGKIETLSVIRCATYSPAYLNRQVIMLLDYLGVPEELLMKMNDGAIAQLNIGKTVKRLREQLKKIKEGLRDEDDEY